MKAFLLDNLNALAVLAGFGMLEFGLTILWGAGVAWLVAGVIWILVGAWPYVCLTLRKRQG